MDSSDAVKALFSVFSAACLSLIGYTTVNGITRLYHGKKKGKIRFLLGLVGVIVTATISAFLYSIGFSTTIGDPGGTESTGESVTTESSEEKESRRNPIPYEGGTYTGEVDPVTNKPDGSGIMYYSDGNIYDGDWKNGLPHGTGIMKYKNGDTYDGQWKNGKRDGHGKYKWRDNRQYIGYYKNGLRDGEGEFIGWTGFAEEYGWSGNYSGTSKEDYFDGKGSFIFENGDQFNGIFRAGRFWDGTYTYSNGSQLQITNGAPST